MNTSLVPGPGAGNPSISTPRAAVMNLRRALAVVLFATVAAITALEGPQECVDEIVW